MTKKTEEQPKENKNHSGPETPLFRKEVLEKKKGTHLGNTLIITPLSASMWTVGIFTIAVILGLFLYFGKYARRETVQGMLVPDKGVIHIYAKNSGIISKRFVNHGDSVKKGQLLYLISTEQDTLSRESLSTKQITLLTQQIDLQKRRVAALENDAERYKRLLKQRFISEVDYQKRVDDYLSSKLQLQELERNLNQAKGDTDYTIRAPNNGTVSALIAMKGDRVTMEKPLISIIPEGTELQGQLFVPSRAIGFVAIGQKVLLRYAAYPYQRFGLYESTIHSIDKSVLLPNEINMPVAMNEPFYRIFVKLKAQTVTVYGKPYPLATGMLLEAVILGEKRTIWQWIMDPIYSLRGSLSS